MSLISDLRALLRKPTAAAEAPSAPRRKNATATDLATEPEYVEALAALDAEYSEAQTLLENAGAERERLLVTGSDFAAIRKLASDIDEAQFRLEAAERIRPELQRGLNIIRFEKRCARWLEVRDNAAAAAEKQLASIAAYEAALVEWRAAYNEVVVEYPEAVEILPRMPGLYSEVSFENQIDTFRTRIMERGRPEMPFIFNLADAIYHAKKTGQVPQGLPGDWQLEVERAMTGEAKVRLNSQIIDADGRTVERGTVLTLPYDDAAAHVSAGRAIYV